MASGVPPPAINEPNLFLVWTSDLVGGSKISALVSLKEIKLTKSRFAYESASINSIAPLLSPSLFIAAEPEASTRKIMTRSDRSSKLKVWRSLGRMIIFFDDLSCCLRSFCHGAADLRVETISIRS